MTDVIPPLDLEKYLADKEKLILVHTFDGEIWGASHAATELLGYSNDEIRQMYLANIKPKTLRLSDVCKTQKSEDAAVIFERRNGRRFAAQVYTRMIRTTLLRATIDLVMLELQIVNNESVNTSKNSQFNIHEVTDYINALALQSRAPAQALTKTLAEVKASVPQDLAVKLDHAMKLATEVSFINESITDSVKIGVNALELERQPFNLIDVLSELVLDLSHYTNNVSLGIEPEVPELVYGDEKRLLKIAFSLARQVISDLSGHTIKFFVAPSSDSDTEDPIQVVMTCRSDLEADAFKLAVKRYEESPSVFICNGLIKFMGGQLEVAAVEPGVLSVCYAISLPEVHDLGLQCNRRFLAEQTVTLVELEDSTLKQQVEWWGGKCERITDLAQANKTFSQLKDDAENIVIIRLTENVKAPVPELQDLLSKAPNRTIFIRPDSVVLHQEYEVMTESLPCLPWRFGNILSQLVKADLPYPYSSINRNRLEKDLTGAQRVLIVDSKEELREQYSVVMADQGMDVDVAVNGIDSVLACAHNHYDLIIMDSDLPHMDGYEAVAHIRRISETNISTPIIVLSSVCSKNDQLTVEQIGASVMLEKPVDLKGLLTEAARCLEMEVDLDKQMPRKTEIELHRKSDGVVDLREAASQLIDTDVIHRLENDTNKATCREMVDIFIEECLITIYKLENCCKQSDWKSVAGYAHELCSSAKTFGCEALHEVAKKLEIESKNNNLSECMSLSSQLPQVFLSSQRGLYDICAKKVH